MTAHLLVGSLLIALLATAILGQVEHLPAVQPAAAAVQQIATTAPGPGFGGAFGHGAALRNLVF